MKRKETITSIIKNKWVWSGLAIVIGLVVASVGWEDDEFWTVMIGIYLIFGGIYGLIACATKK